MPDIQVSGCFAEAVVAGSGDIEIRDITGSGADTRTVAVGSVTLSHGDDLGNDLATIDPGVDLRKNRTYAVLVAATAFDDAVGNSYAGITDDTFWRFETKTDATAPSVVTYSPANGESDVDSNVDLELTFDENVEAGSGTITITNLTDHTGVDIDVSDAGVTISGVIHDHCQRHRRHRGRQGLRRADQRRRDQGLRLGGLSRHRQRHDMGVRHRRDSAERHPFPPVDEAAQVLLTTDLVLTFDEDVALGTGDITIEGTGDSPTIDVASAAPDSVDVAGNVVTIGLATDLQATNRYTVTIDSGAIHRPRG